MTKLQEILQEYFDKQSAACEHCPEYDNLNCDTCEKAERCEAQAISAIEGLVPERKTYFDEYSKQMLRGNWEGDSHKMSVIDGFNECREEMLRRVHGK